MDLAQKRVVVPTVAHNRLISAAFRARGFTDDEAETAAAIGAAASRHGNDTHNAIKALHLDDHFGSKAGGCVPGAQIEPLPSRYKAVARWNAHRKLGQAVALAAMQKAMRLADEFGIGVVAVDNAFHYLWGGAYVIDAAHSGYIAYTCCTAALAEVVPFGGRTPTLGTNPHSWAFPTVDLIGFPICIDFATSMIATGRVQQLAREGRELPADCALDGDGKVTRDPSKAKAMLPFGAHKGFGLGLLDELMAAYIGGSIPTIRNRWPAVSGAEKGTCAFYFQCIRPDALACDGFAAGRSQQQNVKAVIEDILGHGNQAVILPGQPEAAAASNSDSLGGLLFSEAEILELDRISGEIGMSFESSTFRRI
jgi:LDH2 family malate/lactate/ureidoglycolate dehydrogenase